MPAFRYAVPLGWLATGLAAALPLAIALAGPWIAWDQGCVEQETTTFIRQYTAADGRSVLQKVFDPHANDLGTYQARELSYFLDLVDAHAAPILAGWFGPGFSLPLSSFAVSVTLVLLVFGGLRRHLPGADRLTTSLLLACLVSSFCYISTLGLFYRTAKPVLAVVIVAWVVLLLRRLAEGGERSRPGTAAGLCLLTIAAGLLDRQGMFLSVTAAALLALHWWRTRELADAAVAAGLGVVAIQAYSLVLAPAMVFALNGYWPDFSYQRLPASEILRLPNHLLRAASLLAQNTLLLFGGNWVVSGALALGVAGLAWRHGRRMPGAWRARIVRVHRSERWGALVTWGGWILLAQLVMFALMIARHGYVYRWIDHRFWYYPLPFLMLVLCGALLTVHRWRPQAGAAARLVVPVVLALVVVSNLASIPHQRAVMATGPWFGEIYPQCERLKTSLRTGRPDPDLDAAYRALYEHSVAAQAARR